MRGFKLPWAVLPLTLLAVLAAPQPRVHAAVTWHAAVGAQSHDKGRQALAFLPNELWVHAGDSVTWTWYTDEIHTVTFLQTDPLPQTRPDFATGCPGVTASPATFDGTTCITSPPLVTGSQYTVQFPSAGNYKLVCLVHENMTATIHVLAATMALPHTQAYYDRLAADQAWDLLSDADADHEAHRGDRGHHHGDHTVVVGRGEISATAGGSSTLSVMRFMEPLKIVHAGDTVEWDDDDPVTPHTITFGTEPGNPIPPSLNVTIDPDGARHATLNSPFDSAHSGFIVAAYQDQIGSPQVPLGATRFRVTFTHAGVYPYICALHDDLGMKGKIIVLP
ncbi:MAG TPA: plastocyanin/azurin family copper-binding protein [Vicinamibacterales bacterium]|nr:plastocyanin/azurin family copper-binding protein [Vicinamibacterales bacterium]